ncbi:MAG: hypothetical protein JWM57_1912 [Phycisphaerales bacterium]|nr:hypothetical protein [Phycisphaerales bacterium]
MAKPNRPARAFSLVELVLMLAIISITAAIGAPRYANSIALYRSQMAAQRIAADLNLARSRARSSSLGQSITFSVASNTYTLPGVTGLSGTASSYSVKLSADPYAGTLLTADFSGSATLTFDRYGQPSAAGTVTVKSGSFTQTVALDGITGLAAVQ